MNNKAEERRCSRWPLLRKTSAGAPREREQASAGGARLGVRFPSAPEVQAVAIATAAAPRRHYQRVLTISNEVNGTTAAERSPGAELASLRKWICAVARGWFPAKYLRRA